MPAAPPPPRPETWYRVAHICIFVLALVLMYFVMAEVFSAANVINPVRWITGSGINLDDQTYPSQPWKSLDADRASDVRDRWASAWKENTELVRDFRSRHRLKPMVLDEGPEDRRVPVLLGPQFDDYAYDVADVRHTSDLAGLVFGQWRSVPSTPKPGSDEWRTLVSRVSELERRG